jgi:hypothetical protein
MNLRHSAALAAVAWYLLSPPVVPPGDRMNTRAPLRKWEKMAAFDTAADCKGGLAGLAKSAADPKEMAIVKQRAKSKGRDFDERLFRLRLKTSICVSTTDPRLKK